MNSKGFSVIVGRLMYTQIELSFRDLKEVWWIPVPENLVKVGEVITKNTSKFCSKRTSFGYLQTEVHQKAEPWKITGVFVTLPEDKIPTVARVSYTFRRKEQAPALMEM